MERWTGKQINNLKELIKDIEKSNLLTTPNKYFKSVQFYKLQAEVLRIFEKALENIKPVGPNELVHEMFDCENPWTHYTNFNYKKYIKEAISISWDT